MARLSKEEPMQGRDFAVIYWLGTQKWVPHYTKAGVFVAPGGVERTEHELLDLGAFKGTGYLWPRHWQRRGT